MNKNDIKQKLYDKAARYGFANFNIDNPQTWCEKIAWLQLNDNIQLRAKCADKIGVHRYSIKKLGKDICVPFLKVYNYSPNEIKFNELPDKFVLKCNHGWNMNIVVDDKHSCSQEDCIKKIKKWIDTPFGINSIEPHYLEIERKCFAERHIGKPLDYKFWCFNGSPFFCTVNSNIGENGGTHYNINWYDMDWNILPYSRIDHPSNPSKLDAKPSQFELMKEYAKKLSEDFRFVRVDFYEVDGVVYLGEMTFTPATGFIKWADPTIDRKFGNLIKL